MQEHEIQDVTLREPKLQRIHISKYSEKSLMRKWK